MGLAKQAPTATLPRISARKVKRMTELKKSKPRVGALLISALLVFSLCTGMLAGGQAHAQSGETRSRFSNQSAQADRESYPALSRYATDLTRQARAGRLEAATNRDAEINLAIQILSRDTHINPVLIGEAGPKRSSNPFYRSTSPVRWHLRNQSRN